MATKHTPQTWEYEERCSGIAIVHKFEDTEKIIATILSHGEDEDVLTNEDEANAQLIAVAPELLQLSKDLIEAIDQQSFFMEGYKNGSASISEVIHAGDELNEAKSKLWNLIYPKFKY